MPPGHGREGALEARGPAHGHQILWVGAAAGAAELPRRADVHVQLAVRGVAVSVLAASGGVGFGGVEDVRHRCSPGVMTVMWQASVVAGGLRELSPHRPECKPDRQSGEPGRRLEAAMAGSAGVIGPGRVAVVTGAASGIGLGLCERFAAEGMSVVMADVEEPALSEAAAKLAAGGAACWRCAQMCRALSRSTRSATRRYGRSA